MINLKINYTLLFVAALSLMGGMIAGCNNDSAAAPKGLDAQKAAVIGGTPPPEAQKQIEAMRAEGARKQAEGNAAGEAAARAADAARAAGK
ncbi:MAG: hypothetical protein H8F28_05075 [Fibrella sp.]|nr:hypothetical protein [Armatimonadota bacterium]